MNGGRDSRGWEREVSGRSCCQRDQVGFLERRELQFTKSSEIGAALPSDDNPKGFAHLHVRGA